MSEHEKELNVLRHAADGMLLYHNGLWGAPAGYRWAGPDGASAGQVPQWETEVLDLLERRHLVSVRQGFGAKDRPVLVTEAGLRVLSSVNTLAA